MSTDQQKKAIARYGKTSPKKECLNEQNFVSYVFCHLVVSVFVFCVTYDNISLYSVMMYSVMIYIYMFFYDIFSDDIFCDDVFCDDIFSVFCPNRVTSVPAEVISRLSTKSPSKPIQSCSSTILLLKC